MKNKMKNIRLKIEYLKYYYNIFNYNIIWVFQDFLVGY